MKTPNVKHIRSGWSVMGLSFIVLGIVFGCAPSSWATGECLFGEVVEVKGMILEVRVIWGTRGPNDQGTRHIDLNRRWAGCVFKLNDQSVPPESLAVKGLFVKVQISSNQLRCIYAITPGPEDRTTIKDGVIPSKSLCILYLYGSLLGVTTPVDDKTKTKMAPSKDPIKKGAPQQSLSFHLTGDHSTTGGGDIVAHAMRGLVDDCNVTVANGKLTGFITAVVNTHKEKMEMEVDLSNNGRLKGTYVIKDGDKEIGRGECDGLLLSDHAFWSPLGIKDIPGKDKKPSGVEHGEKR